MPQVGEVVGACGQAIVVDRSKLGLLFAHHVLPNHGSTPATFDPGMDLVEQHRVRQDGKMRRGNSGANALFFFGEGEAKFGHRLGEALPLHTHSSRDFGYLELRAEEVGGFGQRLSGCRSNPCDSARREIARKFERDYLDLRSG